jgi:hypothetical protein
MEGVDVMESNRIIKYKKGSKAGDELAEKSAEKSKAEMIKLIKECDGFVVFAKKDDCIAGSAMITNPFDVLLYINAMQQTVRQMMESTMEGMKDEM